MKRILYISLLLIIPGLTAIEASGQNCNKFHLYGACMQYPGPNYKIDGQSRSNAIGLGDKLVYNVIFYGNRNYKLFFCCSDVLMPVHYILTDSENGELIYDSKKDNNLESIELNIEKTRRIMLEISVLGTHAGKDNVQELLGCTGMLIYYRPVEK